MSVAASGNAGLTASPTSLTFTPSNFATAQTVTVTANATGTGTTTFTASGGGYTSAVVTATEVTGSTGGGSITATPASLNVTQGATGTFTLALSKAPTANVTVAIAASGNAGLTESPTSLTFTPSNFSTAQTVTVTANSSGTGATTFTASASGYTGATVTATEVAPATGSAPQLHVSGNKLVDANGNTVVLHGVDRSGTEYACVQGNGIFDGPNDQASITAMKSWGPVNAVRVPLNEACWNAESYVNSADAGANYINAIKSYVSLLNSNGIVAILDLHWTDGTYTGPGQGSCTSSNQAESFCQKPMPDAAQAIPFWTSVANTFKGNDAVIFDLFNEPFPEQADSTNETEGWQCWLNGGSSCVGISYTGRRHADAGQRGPLRRREQRPHARWPGVVQRPDRNGCSTSRPTRTTTWSRPGTPTTSTRAARSRAGRRRWPRSPRRFRWSPARSARTTAPEPTSPR